MNKNIILNDVLNSVNTKKSISISKNNVSRKSIALKTITLLLVTIATTIITFFLFNGGLTVQPAKITALNDRKVSIILILFVLPIISFILIIGSRFLPVQMVKYVAMTYSIFEGMFFGVLFCLLNIVYDNVLMLVAIDLLSVSILFILMNLAFYNNIIKVTKKFVIFIMISMFMIVLFDLIILFSRVYSGYSIKQMNPFLGAFVSIFAIIIGTLSLAMDFKYAEQIIQQNISKEYEWQVALGFQITLIYIFIRILELMYYAGLFRERK
ncbi:conserved hypothetical protein [Candidatus Phytoplasma mali]|uniref:Uncharacterized protein n=1 Tax=Phytoplasma mali (strain AT) TaxID=482235 RepID=B3R032_PHYMT|nr:Bax inhibitor-1/YccA family protein [Candidatus Phytoplasma mali]CAP18196.1 conserved hypothetical protein [Candidatus Phytoplasma mali]CAP18676.1 conserved hypothetical protein [Candidatus Phytoplasma mali]